MYQQFVRSIFIFLSFIFLHLGTPESTAATSWKTEFKKAYDSNEFSEALELVRSNAKKDSAEDQFNLANTFYRLKKYGKAVYHLEWAHALAPQDPDISFNLNLVKEIYSEQLGGASLSPSAHWVDQLGAFVTFETLLDVIGWLLWFITASLLIPYYRSRNWLRAITHPIAVSGFVLFFSLSTLAFLMNLYGSKELKILNKDFAIRSGPGEKFLPIRNVYLGMKLKLTGDARKSLQEAIWQQVEFSDGQVGWIHEDALVTLPKKSG